MALLCSNKDKKNGVKKQKKKKAGSARKWLPKGWLSKGNGCGRCGEAPAKLNELIAGPNKVLDLIVLIV